MQLTVQTKVKIYLVTYVNLYTSFILLTREIFMALYLKKKQRKNTQLQIPYGTL